MSTVYVPTILIVGCEISGLVAGLALLHEFPPNTIRPLILERRPQLDPRPNTLMLLSPNATRTLKHLELLDALLSAFSDDCSERPLRRASDGAVLRTNVTPAGHPPMLLTLVRDTTDWLYRQFLARGGEVRFGERVTGFEEEEGKDIVRVMTAAGGVYKADLVLAADGSQSVLRESIVPPSEAQPYAASTIVTQCYVPVSIMRSDPLLTELHQSGPSIWVGQDFCVISVAQAHLDAYCVNFLEDAKDGVVPPHDDDNDDDDDDDDDDDNKVTRDYFSEVKAKMQQQFRTDYAAKLVEAMTAAAAHDDPKVRKPNRYVAPALKPLSTWRSRHGRVVLVGDAAHAMPPDYTQNASQCVESAHSLALFCRHAVQSSADIPAMTLRFEKFRKPRAERALDLGHRCAKAFKNPELIGPGRPDPLDGKDIQWLYEYDVTQETIDQILR